MDLTLFGRLRANPLANIDNNLKLTECACLDNPACLDTGTQALASNITVDGITYKGVSYTFDSILVTNPAAIQAAIYNVIAPFEVESIVKVAYAGGSLSVEHTGAGTLSLVVTSGTDVTMERFCTVETICDYNFCTSGTGIVTVDGVALASSPFTYDTETPENNAGIASDLEDELAAVLTTSTVTVTVDSDNERFCALIRSAAGDEIVINDVRLIQSNCAQEWVEE